MIASKTTGLGDQKPAKKPRRRIPLSSVGTKEAEKLRKESKFTPPSPTKPTPKPRKNSNVQDIVDGLRQILDVYDGSMGGHGKKNKSPHAKATNSTGGTYAQRKVEKKMNDLFERYKNHDKEEEDSDGELTSWSDVGQESEADSEATITDDEQETKNRRGGGQRKRRQQSQQIKRRRQSKQIRRRR